MLLTMAVAEVMEGVGVIDSHQGPPTGIPMSYGPVGGNQGAQDATPLFTQDQLRRLHDLQQQAPYLYRSEVVKVLGMVKSQDNRSCLWKKQERTQFRTSGQVERWQVQAELKQLRWTCNSCIGIGINLWKSLEG